MISPWPLRLPMMIVVEMEVEVAHKPFCFFFEKRGPFEKVCPLFLIRRNREFCGQVVEVVEALNWLKA